LRWCYVLISQKQYPRKLEYYYYLLSYELQICYFVCFLLRNFKGIRESLKCRRYCWMNLYSGFELIGSGTELNDTQTSPETSATTKTTSTALAHNHIRNVFRYCNYFFLQFNSVTIIKYLWIFAFYHIWVNLFFFKFRCHVFVEFL
jgi:hypothetical protein